MRIKARVNMLLEVDSEELEDMLEELVDHLDGTALVRLNIKCTGGQLND